MFPAIAWREATVKARQESLMVQRVLLAAVAVAMVLGLLLIAEVMRSPRGMGEFMYHFLGWTCMILGGLEGLRQTLDSLSREKREGTLGLLMLTRVTSLDLVLGKWVVHALATFYHLLAIFPALAIPLVLGGVTLGEFVRLLLCVMNGLFVALALGMLVSARGREEYELWATGLSWLVLLMAAPPALVAIITSWQGSTQLAWAAALSPLRAWQLAPATAYSLAPGQFWSALVFSHLLGWLLLALAAWSMGREWKRLARGAAPKRLGRLDHLLLPVLKVLRWWERRAAGDRGSSPVERFLRNDRLPAGLVLALLAVGVLALVVLSLYTLNDLWVVYLAAGLFYAAHWGLRFWAAAQSCQVPRQLRDSGWLFILLAAPLQPAELPQALLQSQLPALRMAFSLLMAMEVLVAATFFMLFWPTVKIWVIFSLPLWFLAALILWRDLKALNAAGLWHSLNLNHSALAIRRTIFQVLLLPLLAAPLGFFCMGLAIPFLMIVKSVVLYYHFRGRLLRDFRLGLERTQVVTAEPLPEKILCWLGLKKAPPRLASRGPVCVSCGHEVGDAAYCPFCGYRQPGADV
ncbi:MAG: ABC transporter permease subunit [Verrucomicrobiae bacterium]|nr:ABC transporter permease subunit [Verrucomicrobiae bacterium]